MVIANGYAVYLPMIWKYWEKPSLPAGLLTLLRIVSVDPKSLQWDCRIPAPGLDLAIQAEQNGIY
jgi:hypothetical protein